MHISKNIFDKVYSTQGLFVEKLSRINADKVTKDFLSFEKPKEQIKIIQKYYPNLKGKKLLEIGSGLGVFNLVSRKAFGIDSWGVEPGGEGFGGSFEISHEILKENDLSIDHILNSRGEILPFENNSFDIVYSTNVLEHVENPEKVIGEGIRVCKKGGIIQMVAPNYGSFFDGHYACFYFPYQPKWFWKIWLKYILRRDPSFVDSLRTEINCFSVRSWLAPYLKSGQIEILATGEDVFKSRMEQINFSTWAGLEKVKRWIVIAHKLKIIKIITATMIFAKAYTPLIITLRKK